MSRHEERVHLAHMRDYVRTAREISEGKNRADLDADKIYRYALLHIVTILVGASFGGVRGTNYTARSWIPARLQ